VPVAGARAAATAVPAGGAGTTPLAAAAVVLVRGAVTACWVEGLQGRLGEQRQSQCLPLRFPPFPL